MGPAATPETTVRLQERCVLSLRPVRRAIGRHVEIVLVPLAATSGKCLSILMDAARQYVWTILNQSVGIKMVDIRNDPLVSGTAMT
jgi:hypothetical protein